MDQLKFYDTEHKNFFNEHTKGEKLDSYNKSLIYLLGLTEETRKHFDKLYNERTRQIELSGTTEGWQTGTSLATTKLAFNLFNGYSGLEDRESRLYTVENIFCYKEYAPYFYEGIKLRFNIQDHKSKEQQQIDDFIKAEESKLQNWIKSDKM